MDLITKNTRLEIGGRQVCIDEKIEGTVLLQQYTINMGNNIYMVSKGDRGSYLRRIPKIYDNI